MTTDECGGAAVKGLENLTLAYQLTGVDERLAEIRTRLDEIMVDTSGKKREHIQRARNDAPH